MTTTIDEPYDVVFVGDNSDAIDPELMQILQSNKLYNDLYEILEEYNLTLKTLQQLKLSQFDAFSKELNLTTIQTLKMRTLITEIRKMYKSGGTAEMKAEEEDVELRNFLNDNQLPSNLYDALITEGITYQSLDTIAPYDIDQICADCNIKIGVKLNLKSAVEKHQLEVLQQKYSTPGSLQFAEKIEQKEEANDFDHQMKCVLIGDSAVGKTKLFKRYICGTFDVDAFTSTIGIDFGRARQRMSDGSVMRLEIWDTAGQERFKSIARRYYHGADAIIVCYGVDDRDSFQNCDLWRKEIEEHANKDVVVMLVGCKADIEKRAGRGNIRQVSIIDAQEKAKSVEWNRLGCIWGECSSKSGSNVEAIFRSVAEKVLIIRSENSPDEQEAAKVQLEGNQSGRNPQSSGCC